MSQLFTKNKKFIYVFLAILFVFIGKTFLKGLYLLTTESDNAGIVTGLLVGIVVLILPGLFKRDPKYFFYLFLFLFPFVRVYQKGINLVILYGLVFCLIYRTKLIRAFLDKRFLYSSPILLILFSICVTFIAGKYRFHNPIFFQIYPAFLMFLIAFFIEIRKKEDIRIIGRIVIALLCFCLLISLVQLVFGVNSVKLFTGTYNTNVTSHGMTRYPSVFWEAQSAGMFFSVFGILAAGFLKCIMKKNNLIPLFIGIALIGVLLSSTRIAFASLILGLIFMFLAYKQYFHKKVVVVILIMISISLAGVFFAKNIESMNLSKRLTKDDIQDSFEFRMNIWREGFEVIKNNPFGVGLGGYHLDFGLMANRKIRDTGVHFENSYIDFVCSLGLLGGVGGFLLIYIFFKSGFKLYKASVTIPELELSLYVMGAATAWLISAITSAIIRSDHSIMIFVILLGLMNSLYVIYYSNLQTKINKE